ncbi:hypothetical protein E2C01_086463 [Portunus trituberculatus]|uniref:Uncharacterized protein n=1 Tax=Portunus trituberculatus TaxID=210409 RepID=A0A5B7JDJ4_PORTR|nr:hypothetical protein [Portunus trituberculatus]
MHFRGASSALPLHNTSRRGKSVIIHLARVKASETLGERSLMDNTFKTIPPLVSHTSHLLSAAPLANFPVATATTATATAAVAAAAASRTHHQAAHQSTAAAL